MVRRSVPFSSRWVAKAVAQRMHRHRLRQAGILLGVMADRLQRSRAEVLEGLGARE